MVVHMSSLATLILCVTCTVAITLSLGEECIRKCGDVSVPYPFGLDDNPLCSIDPSFNLNCDKSVSPPILFIGNIPILNISLENATADISFGIAYECYNQSGVAAKLSLAATLGRDRPFLFSTRNRLTVIGCDTIGYAGNTRFDSSTCVSACNSRLSSQYNYTEELISCQGIGCCQNLVPKGLNRLLIEIESYNNHSNQLETNPCGFGFLSDPSWYKDSADFTLTDTPDKHLSSPVVLDWAIRRNITCEDKDNPKYICGSNTNCTNSDNGPGYLCHCNQGFKGNPYTKPGCEDINECDDPQTYPCYGKCKNTSGNYTCACSFGRHGEGKSGCSLTTASKIAIGIGAAVLFSIFILFLFWLHKRQIKKVIYRHNEVMLDELSVGSYKEPQSEMTTDSIDSKNLLREVKTGQK